MFGSRVQDEVEMQRRTTNRIFPDERQDQPKLPFQAARVDRFAANRIDAKNLEKLKLLNEGNKPWQRGADPGSSMVLRWNRVYLMACLFALFIDPFFYYLPLVRVDGETSCIAKDRRLRSTITALRSLADLFYVLNIVVKFHTAYVDPKSRVLGKGELIVDLKRIRRRYMRTYLFIDLLAAVPLPQVTVWLVMPGIKRSDYNVRITTFALIIMTQYVLRMCLVVPLSNRIIKAAGVVTKSAWGGAAYNLLLYMLASHITGAIYYLLSVERRRKLSESLSRWESYSWWSEEHPVADKPKQEGTSSGAKTAAEGAAAQMHKFASASRRFAHADDTMIRRLQKPDEPDFTADHFD